MSVYKELLYMIREVESQSVQIYPDACDNGVPIKSCNDAIIHLLRSIKEQYDGKVSTEKYSTGSTQTITIKWYDEWDTHKRMVTDFVYVTTRGEKKQIGYLYVQTK
jgi:hypothetical protein